MCWSRWGVSRAPQTAARFPAPTPSPVLLRLLVLIMANTAGPVIADDVLAARDVLPAKLAPVTLETDHITLRPFVESDIAPLFSACNGQPFNGHPAYDPADMWRFMFVLPPCAACASALGVIPRCVPGRTDRTHLTT